MATLMSIQTRYTAIDNGRPKLPQALQHPHRADLRGLDQTFTILGLDALRRLEVSTNWQIGQIVQVELEDSASNSASHWARGFHTIRTLIVALFIRDLDQ